MTKNQALQSLLDHVEAKDEYADGSVWGTVYLPNVGDTRSFAGALSQLKQSGEYRSVSKDFGEVKMR